MPHLEHLCLFSLNVPRGRVIDSEGCKWKVLQLIQLPSVDEILSFTHWPAVRIRQVTRAIGLPPVCLATFPLSDSCHLH